MDKKLMFALLDRAEDGNSILKILDALSEMTSEYIEESNETPEPEEVLVEMPEPEEVLVEMPKPTHKRSRKENLVQI